MSNATAPLFAALATPLLLLLATAANAYYPRVIQILPSAPQSQERVTLRVNYVLPDLCGTASVSLANNTFKVILRCVQVIGQLPPNRNGSLDVELGRFPAGDYSVVTTEGNPSVLPISNAFKVTERHEFVAPYAFPIIDYTDHWWNPQESGWGMSIAQHPSDRLFVVWFVYNQAGQPLWYTLQPGTWTSPNAYTGPVYKTTGPYYGGPFDPGQVGIAQVGTATLSFADSTSGTFSYMVDGVSGSKPITRLPF